MVICKKGTLQSSGLPKGYDAERFIFMAVMDENKSWYLGRNMDKYCTSAQCGGVDKGFLLMIIIYLFSWMAEQYLGVSNSNRPDLCEWSALDSIQNINILRINSSLI